MDIIMDLSGRYAVTLADGRRGEAALPGTLDEAGIGDPDLVAEAWHPDEHTDDGGCNEGLHVDGVITSRFTRRFLYDGAAVFARRFSFDAAPKALTGKRFFLFVERSRKLSVRLNGAALSPYEPGTLSTPWQFELTSLLKKENHLELTSDNTYPGWPAEAIRTSSAATNETQTNWNGVIGRIELHAHEPNFIVRARVLPKRRSGGIDASDGFAFDCSPRCADVVLEFDAAEELETGLALRFSSAEEPSPATTLHRHIHLARGRSRLTLTDLALPPAPALWDEGEGRLCQLTLSGERLETKTVVFGLRSFGTPGAPYLTLNGRRIFLRSEANCAVFPETGHPPMEEAAWLEILRTYQRYGVNCLRFHSWCPPEAAFSAADRLGLLVQPELSNWDPRTAFESDEAYAYYRDELRAVLETYGNHPSFVMLTLGNELHCGEKGEARMKELLASARDIDPTRLYARASNPFYGARGADEESDFYTSSNAGEYMIRGTSADLCGAINNEAPNAGKNYDKALQTLRQRYHGSVFSFEVGQYEILPDFHEIDAFHGVTLPRNLEAVRQRVTAKGLLPYWERMVAASGELARIAYREEIEAALRTGELSGISLLGLQDFPGQGTALVGMLNSHLQPKPYAFSDPARFRPFFCDVVPMAFPDRYVYTADERFSTPVGAANYGKDVIDGTPLFVTLTDRFGTVLDHAQVNASFPQGMLSTAGTVTFSLTSIHAPAKLTLRLQLGDHENSYPIWVYSSETHPEALFSGQEDTAQGHVVIASTVRDALVHLKDGETVLLSPPTDAAHFPSSFGTAFTTDFWSVGTFPRQEGYMGLLIDETHPIFRYFPTDFHADWQWWHLTHNARAVPVPAEHQTPIRVIDSYARLRSASLLSMWRCAGGKLAIDSMGLPEKQAHPEARALLKGILAYMGAEDFAPVDALSPDALGRLVTDQTCFGV